LYLNYELPRNRLFLREFILIWKYPSYQFGDGCGEKLMRRGLMGRKAGI
jgi:hypothetical protein